MEQHSFVFRIKQYFQDKVWKLQYTGKTSLSRGFHGAVCRIILVVRDFLRLDLASRASSLTYSTLFSTIPLLAILFAIAKGFGLETFIEEQIREALPGETAVADTIIGFVLSYLNHTKGGVFVGMGLCLLLYTLLSLVANIEQTFNQIWKLDSERSLFRKITDYTALLFIFPLFAIITGGISIFISSVWDDLQNYVIIGRTYAVLVELFPYLLMVLALTGFYIFMPNTQVRFKSALVGGIPAGIAFQLVQYVYIHFQLWVTSYNAIYGSFAALPLFMLWCQISWYICLFGANLCYVDQNIRFFTDGKQATCATPLHKTFLGVLVMKVYCQRYVDRQFPYSVADVARQLKQPLHLVREVSKVLLQARLLVAVVRQDNEPEVYMPAVNANTITVAEVIQALMGGTDDFSVTPEYETQWKSFEQMQTDIWKHHTAQTLVKDFGNVISNE